ncbi:MAG: TRAP transporter small permease [Alphaproteobacteria bacterium]|nr:TRAP transporter small permease [Alphaproteobacteria bacterium]
MLVRGSVRAIVLVEAVARLAAAVMMAAVMLIVVADVVLRYVFNSPLAWAYDFVSLYLMVGIFFLVLSDSYMAGALVSVDLLQQLMPAAVRGPVDLLIAAVGFVVFALIAYVGGVEAVGSFLGDDVVAGAIAWPTWPGHAFVPVGAGLLAIRLLLHFVVRAAALATGYEPPPLAVPQRAGAGAPE